MADKLKGNLANIISQLQRIAVDLEASGDLEAQEVKDITQALGEVNLLDVAESASKSNSVAGSTSQSNGIVEINKDSLPPKDVDRKFFVRNIRSEVPEHKLGRNIFDQIQSMRKAQELWTKKGTENVTLTAAEEIAIAKANHVVDKDDEEKIEEFSKEAEILEESMDSQQTQSTETSSNEVDLSMLTAKEEKAILDILEKLKTKRVAATSQDSYGESYFVSVKERRNKYGHESMKVAKEEPLVSNESAGEEVNQTPDLESIEIQREETTAVQNPGMIVLDKDTNRRRTLPNQPQAKTIYVDVKPKGVGGTTISMKTLDRGKEDIFSEQAPLVSDTSPIKTELESILSAHAQNRNFDSLPVSPLPDENQSLSNGFHSTSSENMETVSSSSISDEIAEKENDSTSQEVVDESAVNDPTSKEVVNAQPEVAEQSLEEPPIPAPRKMKTEYKQVSRISQGNSLFTMGDYRERGETKLLW